MEIKGAEAQAEFEDEHGNGVLLVALNSNETELVIHSRGTLNMIEQGGVIGNISDIAPLWLYKRSTDLTKSGPLTESLAETISGVTDVVIFHELAARIAGRVEYMTGSTVATTTAEQALSLGQGVCQDHAHIFITAVRHAGHPARYVSGYLMMNDRVEQDATHAWAEVWLDGLGWTGFDISNGISPDSRYVRLATGLDYKQAAPISGLTIGGSGESMHVDVRVQQQ